MWPYRFTSAETTWQHTWPWPVWFALVLAALLALVFIWFYRREERGPSKLSWLALVALRLLAVWLLIWMMFGWLQQRHRTEPADLIIGLDDSASMAFGDDQWDSSAFAKLKRFRPADRTTKPSRFEIAKWLLVQPRSGWLSNLSNHYDVKVVLVADSVRELSAEQISGIEGLSPNRPASRLGTGLRSLCEAQRGRPTAAIVLLTDGVTTEGPTISEAADLARQRAIPLYLVGIGSDKPVRDLRLSDLIADDIALVDDVVIVTCQVHATGFAGQKSSVRLTRSDTGETLAEQAIVIPRDAERASIRLSFRAPAVGEYPLQVVAAPLAGEADVENNRLPHNLTVHDATIRVLLVQGYPSYEYRYLKNLLFRATKPGGNGTDKAFSLTTILQEADREWAGSEPTAATVFPLQRDELFKYDVIVFGDADPAFVGGAASANLVDFVRERGGGVLFIGGSRYMPLAYHTSPIAKLFPFDVSSVSIPPDTLLSDSFKMQLTPVGQLMPQCQLLSNPEENAQVWRSLPPLYWQMDVPNASPAARVLVEHPTRLSGHGQRMPLVLLQYFGAGKVVFHATDELFRWARFDESEEFYSRYWLQTIRYLGRAKLLGNRSPAEISVDRQQFVPGEDVPLRVRFWQAGAAPQPPHTVTVVVEQDNGPKQEVALQAQETNPPIFSGSVSALAPGRYRIWLAAPNLEPPVTPRSFTVARPAQEQSRRALNAGDLERAATISRGRFYTLKNVDRMLAELPRGQRIRVESLPPEPVWNSSLVAALFVMLLTSEWILRKRAGLI